jgi:hypothetical protein
MASLDPAADRVVRDAVDAFIEGRLAPDLSGETVFETKNSRYRLLDGVVFSAPDNSLLGAELVGWLVETPRRNVVESAWAPGSRAVLVDRARGRSIIVTSSTRLLHLEDSGSDSYHPGSAVPHPAYVVPPSPIPPAALRPSPLPPPFTSQRAPIIPSTPPPPFVAPPSPAHAATQPSPVYEPQAPAASPMASPIPPAKRAPAVHLPPRPIASRPSPIPAASPSQLRAMLRPLPVPTPPPRAAAAPPVNGAHSSPGTTPDNEWELTSAEFEVASEDADTEEMETWRNPPNDASHQHARGPDSVDGPDSAGAPIPLVRAIPAPPPPPSAPMLLQKPAPRRSDR